MANSKHDVFKYYDMSVGEDECWRWTGPTGGRSRALRPYFAFENTRMIAYRAVYELVHGIKLTSDQLIRHTCDCGDMPIGCGNPNHLQVGTNTENMDDMKRRQRHGLTHHVVRRIRKLYGEGRSQDEIADLYGISQSLVSRVVTKELYGHVGIDDDQLRDG